MLLVAWLWGMHAPLIDFAVAGIDFVVHELETGSIHARAASIGKAVHGFFGAWG